MPRELNLTPLWFHRLDEQGNLLEADCLWPIIHYEQTTEGGDDFRIRPLYRRVTEPETKATEQQFLWPLGRVRTDPEETSQRLFPLWSYRRRPNENGKTETDWYALFPLLWGGTSESGTEDYFAFFPFFADIPNFLTYDRFRTVLFPLWVGLDKDGHRHDLLIWPLIGWSSCAEADHQWFRILPLYGYDIEPGKHDRRFLFWPLFSWSWENLDTADPVWSFMFWPFFGIRTGRTVDGLTILWPLFAKTEIGERFYKLNVLWPFFHYFRDDTDDNLVQWWLWPLIGHAQNDRLNNWSILWPLIWLRSYQDPDSITIQQWILPLFWHVWQEWNDGSTEEYTKIWPLGHSEVHRDPEGNKAKGHWSLLSPMPVRGNYAIGWGEMYGFLWQIVKGWQRGPDDDSLDVVGRVYTERTRKGSTTASVPFLFNYEADADGKTVLRLFQFLPIELSSGKPQENQTP